MERVLVNIVAKRNAGEEPCLIPGIPGIVMVVARDGTIEAVSADARHFVGLEQLQLRPEIRHFVHPDDVESVTQTVASSGEGAQSTSLSLRLRHRDGKYRVCEGRMAWGGLGEGLSGVVATLVDISHHVETERQLLALLDGSVQGLVVHRGRQPLFCNSALAEMVGFANREELLRQPSILPFLHEEDRDQIIANVRARLAGQEAPREYEFRLRSLTGQVIWVDCRASVVDWDGAPAVLAACFDITDKKKAEEARRHSEELFTRVFECSPDFMTLSRLSDSVFLNVNQSYLSTFGYTREEVIGKSAVDLGNWATPAERQRLVDAVLANAVVQNLEARLRTKSGRIFSALMSAEILEIDGEEILLVVGRDISDRKAVEAALLESKEAADLANRSKSEFLANMSHELRTPLNAILGFSEIIKNQLHGPIPDPKYVEYAKDIHESGSHLLDIINDILDLSKIEAGRLEVHEQRISIRDVVAGCRRLIEPRASEAGVTLESHVAESLPALLADERLMKQILLNLLSNAVKFTPRGGRIEVSAGLTNNGSLQIAVSDTGIGMDADGIERALRPFGQVDTSLSRKHQGSGLGLPLVVAFTERQGGCFDLESAVGEGTRVTVTFPPEKLVSD